LKVCFCNFHLSKKPVNFSIVKCFWKQAQWGSKEPVWKTVVFGHLTTTF
jgi:hypothetical protein